MERWLSWSKAHDWKSCSGQNLTRVRIPNSPPQRNPCSISVTRVLLIQNQQFTPTFTPTNLFFDDWGYIFLHASFFGYKRILIQCECNRCMIRIFLYGFYIVIGSKRGSHIWISYYENVSFVFPIFLPWAWMICKLSQFCRKSTGDDGIFTRTGKWGEENYSNCIALPL